MYDEVTFWFIFRSEDGSLSKIEEAGTLLEALAVADQLDTYRGNGLILSDIVACLNKPVLGAPKEQSEGNA